MYIYTHTHKELHISYVIIQGPVSNHSLLILVGLFLIDKGTEAIFRKVHVCSTYYFPLGVFKMHPFFNVLVGWHRGKCHSRVTFDKWSPADGEGSIKSGVSERSALVSIGIVWTRQYPCQNPVQQKHTGVTPHLLSPAAAGRGVSLPRPTTPQIHTTCGFKCSVLQLMLECQH